MNAVPLSQLPLRARISIFFSHEPSWCPESASTLGMVMWGLITLLSPRYHLSPAAVLLPVFGLAVGLVRPFFLLRLIYSPRLGLALFGACFWVWIATAWAAGLNARCPDGTYGGSWEGAAVAMNNPSQTACQDIWWSKSQGGSSLYNVISAQGANMIIAGYAASIGQ